MGKEKTGKNEKIDAKKSKAATPSSVEPRKVSGEDVLAVMKKLSGNGIVEFTSRLISDKLGLEPDYGRGKVRRLMKRLKAEGKVSIEQKAVKEKGARKRYTYRFSNDKS